ncbi:MAG: cation transporter [Oscillospiraceae bacterium]|jgi:copper chaperone CopZ|nr:cation transporter [Oscillospiraceae bacterium]MBQ7959307.1 cation transporter [Oscillospiraceae bacterium]
MKKVYKLENLDCANCAAKMEDAINKIDGVENANVSFMRQRLTIEADESILSEIIEKAQKICKKIEPDCRICV